jgi:hypothetical protein
MIVRRVSDLSAERGPSLRMVSKSWPQKPRVLGHAACLAGLPGGWGAVWLVNHLDSRPATYRRLGWSCLMSAGQGRPQTSA